MALLERLAAALPEGSLGEGDWAELRRLRDLYATPQPPDACASAWPLAVLDDGDTAGTLYDREAARVYPVRPKQQGALRLHPPPAQHGCAALSGVGGAAHGLAGRADSAAPGAALRIEVQLTVTSELTDEWTALAVTAGAHLRRLANAISRAPRSDVLGDALCERHGLLEWHLLSWWEHLAVLGPGREALFRDPTFHRSNPQPRLVSAQLQRLEEWWEEAAARLAEEEELARRYPTAPRAWPPPQHAPEQRAPHLRDASVQADLPQSRQEGGDSPLAPADLPADSADAPPLSPVRAPAALEYDALSPPPSPRQGSVRGEPDPPTPPPPHLSALPPPHLSAPPPPPPAPHTRPRLRFPPPLPPAPALTSNPPPTPQPLPPLQLPPPQLPQPPLPPPLVPPPLVPRPLMPPPLMPAPSAAPAPPTKPPPPLQPLPPPPPRPRPPGGCRALPPPPA
eukprot:TRINITY_DN26285_c0_g2_i1.p1 TRINITY_DN26285_c0_g2~~TRINITY_DN26285_c0_g2_i1.p1  ORF type:complete len:501 (+),score=143.54 TRINITY_DN26285_c0_g2_i1:145-1503(+)